MALKKGEWFLLLFNLAYIIPFTISYALQKNYEFLWYIVIFIVILIGIVSVARKFKISPYVLWGLSLWGLMHMAGGGVRVGDSVLYAVKIVHIFDVGDTYILKYDQFVHGYLYFVVVFFLYELLKKTKKHFPKYMFYPVLALISLGIGALNEFAEFLPVVFLEQTGVGGYFNTLLDIVANTTGAVLASIILWIKNR
jgi:uncharacterized membrane protein YjdF